MFVLEDAPTRPPSAATLPLRGRDVVRCTIIAFLALVALGAAAHEIPADVRVNAFVRPHGKELELVLRVPLAAMVDVDFPTHGPGYLDLARVDEALRNAAKLHLIDNITVSENGVPLRAPRLAHARVSLASDRSLTSFETAVAHLKAPPLSPDLELYWKQQLIDVLLEYPIASEQSQFAIHPRLDRLGLRVSTALRFLTPDGAVRGFEFYGDPGLVHLDPRWSEAALRFVASGFWHILEGPDHLLFLACLVIPFRRLRPLVVIVTSFTVGHSISLIGSAFGFAPDGLWFPPLIETLIAVSIVYMALENIVGAATGKLARLLSHRWVAAFAFGLVHGFGFSFALRESLQFAGDHLLTALFGFNLGVEIGQLTVLIVLVPALDLLFRYLLAEKVGVILLSALVLHTAWHWMIDRAGELAKFPLPRIDAAFLASAVRGLIAVLVLALAVLIAQGRLRRWTDGKQIAPAKDAAPAPRRAGAGPE
jgi:hypothetical protein